MTHMYMYKPVWLQDEYQVLAATRAAANISGFALDGGIDLFIHF